MAASGLAPDLQRAVEAALGGTIRSARGVSGGCIHDARRLDLADGGSAFLKSDRVDAHGLRADLFEREAEGLAALAAADALRVPGNATAGRAGDTAFLVMEAIPTGRPGATFWEDFGRGFAELHRRTALVPRGATHGAKSGEPSAPTVPRPAAFGFPHDNYLGGTPQPNPWSDDWVAFVRDHRLGHQLDLARSRGHSTPDLERLGDRLADRLGEILDLPDEPGCLLHGDLWSGNFLADETGAPVLVDPAAYHGHREADLAMTHLFGGFDPRFYAAYEETWPLPPGTGRRQAVYQLYHLLNHLNLFGGGYLAQSLGVLRRLVG